MKKSTLVLIFTTSILLIAACQLNPGGSSSSDSAVSTEPTRTPFSLPPTWTSAPPTVTTTPQPTFTPFLPTETPTFGPTLTPSPDAIQAVLPESAQPLRDQGWVISENPENPISALPYKLPDDTMGIALVEDYRSSLDAIWQWHQESTLNRVYQWRNIRPLRRTISTSLLTFLGQDVSDSWYLGAVSPNGTFIGLVPVDDPQEVFAAITDTPGHTREFFLVEGGNLRLYQWNDAPVLLWELAGAPETALTPSRDTDISGDGQADLELQWWPWSANADWFDAVSEIQFYLPDGQGGYRMIADVPPGMQFTDVNGDGIGEFLFPEPPTRPSSWRVLGWDGNEFVFTTTLPFPNPPVPQVPKVSQLPALNNDLYFLMNDQAYVWPKTGEKLEEVDTIPETTCNNGLVSQEVVSWSPGCVYAVVKIPAEVEGYSLGLLAAGGALIEIPNTFTYIRGYSSFGWDLDNGFLLHARADGDSGLYRIWLDSGLSETIFKLSGLGDDPYGVTDPYSLPDGSLGFSVQGQSERQYPPFGVYSLSSDGTWRMLADIPPVSRSINGVTYFGTIQWSPDGSQFLYRAPFSTGEQPPYSSLLIGAADANTMLDLNPVLGDASNFVWR